MTPSDPSDAVLVRRAAGGDHGAFGLLVRRHGPVLARTVRALGVEAGEVEDVVQIALIAAWRHLADLDPDRPFVAWASVVAANKARDWRRAGRRRRRAAGEPGLEDEARGTPDPAAGPQAMEDRLALRRLAEAVDRLPEGLKRPLIITAVTGLSHAEAGQALGLSPKAVELRIARARRLLDRDRA